MANDTSKAVRVRKYGRHWAVYVETELVAVVVYRKGAFAVKNLLTNLYAQIAESINVGSVVPDERPNRD